MNWLLGKFGLPPIEYTDPAKDKWLAWDKAAHFGGHFFIGLIYTKWLHDPIGGGIFSVSWNTYYEIGDSYRGAGFSKKDWFVGLVGWAFGTVLGLVI